MFVHAPPEQTSVVQPLPSLQSEFVQQTWQLAPQSFGVAGAHEQLAALHTAPALHVPPHLPQFAGSDCRFVSQPGLALQSAKPASQVTWLAMHD